MAKKMTEKQKIALAKWRETAPRDENGKIIIKRKSREQILKEKKAKLAKLVAEAKALKEEINKLDASINKAKIKDLIAGMSLEELQAKLSAK